VFSRKYRLLSTACLTAAIIGPARANDSTLPLPALKGVVISQTTNIDTSANDTWIPIGYNKDRIASVWVQLKSYESLNENSFRINAKSTNENGVQIVGSLDLNCKNKDWYFRPNGIIFQGAPWATVAEGSGIESLAKLLCKNTSARAEWGYTPQTSYLWDHPITNEDPANARGEWIKAYDGDDGEGYYNTAAAKTDNVVTHANFSRTKKGDRSAAKAEDSTRYYWSRSSCKENLASIFYKPDISVNGAWLPPIPGRPGGVGFAVKKAYCK